MSSECLTIGSPIPVTKNAFGIFGTHLKCKQSQVKEKYNIITQAYHYLHNFTIMKNGKSYCTGSNEVTEDT
jgi:hypothetical protein